MRVCWNAWIPFLELRTIKNHPNEMASQESPTTYYLGIDTGATKTHALITDGAGRVLSFESAGPANPQSSGGLRPLEHLLEDLLQVACASAGITKKDLNGAGLGLAGYDWPSQKPAFMQIVQSIGLPDSCALVNDSALGIYAGTSQGWGVCVAAGTSFNCRALGPDGREGRAIGDGTRWGEGAGAVELAQEAARAVIAQWTMRGPQTRLAELFLEHFGAHDMEYLVEGLVLGRYPIRAEMAPQIMACAQTGDAVAHDVVQWAARKLFELAQGAIHQAGLRESAFEVVLMGSFFKAGDLLTRPLTKAITHFAPLSSCVMLDVPPVCGAVVLGMQQSQAITPDQRHTIKLNLADFFADMKHP